MGTYILFKLGSQKVAKSALDSKGLSGKLMEQVSKGYVDLTLIVDLRRIRRGFSG